LKLIPTFYFTIPTLNNLKEQYDVYVGPV